MQWWQDFTGWLITTGLAAAAAFTGGWVIWRYRQDRPRVEWVEERNPSASAWYVTLTNVGDAAAINARVTGVGCSLVARPDNAQTFHRVEPGGHLQVTLHIDADPADAGGNPSQATVDQAAIRVTYLTAPVRHRRRYVATLQLVSGALRVDRVRSEGGVPALWRRLWTA